MPALWPSPGDGDVDRGLGFHETMESPRRASAGAARAVPVGVVTEFIPLPTEPPDGVHVPAWLLLLLGWTIFSLLGQTVLQRRLSRAGISVGNFSMAWKGTAFNRVLVRLAVFYPAVQRSWFDMGSVVGAVGIVAGPATLLYILWTAFVRWLGPSLPATSAGTTTAALGSTDGGLELVPLVPGLTIPLSHAVYLFASLLINGVLHETGHALAALGENVRVLTTGAFVSVGYPGAFVELDSHQLRLAPPAKQFKIYSAGVFHNFVLVGLGAVAIHLLPLLLSPWYTHGSGRVSVVAVQPGSALEGSIASRDVISSVDGTCAVTSAASFYQCIERVRADFDLGVTGFCFPPHESQTAVKSRTECCPVADGDGGSRLCFCTTGRCAGGAGVAGYECLRARRVFQMSDGRCLSQAECRTGDSCIRHVDETNMTRLLRLDVEGREPVLFLGHPLELVRDLQLTDFASRNHNHGSSIAASRKPVHYQESGLAVWLWPPDVEQGLKYFVSLSAALGVLNIVPAFGFDGQYAITAAIEMTELSMTQKAFAVTAICVACTGLLVANILVVLGAAVFP